MASYPKFSVSKRLKSSYELRAFSFGGLRLRDTFFLTFSILTEKVKVDPSPSLECTEI